MELNQYRKPFFSCILVAGSDTPNSLYLYTCSIVSLVVVKLKPFLSLIAYSYYFGSIFAPITIFWKSSTHIVDERHTSIQKGMG